MKHCNKTGCKELNLNRVITDYGRMVFFCESHLQEYLKGQPPTPSPEWDERLNELFRRGNPTIGEVKEIVRQAIFKNK